MKNKKALIIVNSITLTRVLGTFIMPLVCQFLSTTELTIYLACLLLTDAIDGFLARKFKASTIFGSLLDAAADKLLGIATLAVLSQYYKIMIIPIFTETLIMLINTQGALRGSTTESSTLGKIKTWVLGLSMVLGFCTILAPEIITLVNHKKTLEVIKYVILHKEIIINSLAFVTVGAGIIVACDYHIQVQNEIKIAAKEGFEIKEIKLKKGKELIKALFDHDYYQSTRKEPLMIKLGEKK